MQTLSDIEQAIARLPPEDRQELAKWIRIRNFKDDEALNRVAEPAPAYDALPEPHLLTVEEYLEFEETGEIRHEYIAGEIFAMATPTLRHGVIIDNLVMAFNAHLRGNPCRAFSAGVKVHIRIDQADIFYCPDVVIACGDLNMDAKFIGNPKLIVEVLSPSTERTDRREKALTYRHIRELEEYILIAQRTREITFYRRTERWQPKSLTAPDAAAEFRSIELSLPLTRIYEGTS